MKLTFQEKILIIALVFFLLYHFNFITIEGLDNPVTLYNENTPRWMRLMKDRGPHSGIAPASGYTGIDFTDYLLDETPRTCPADKKPPGCGTLSEPYLNKIPRGYPDIFADHRESGAAAPARIIRPALDPDNLLRDGVNPFTERDLEIMLGYFENQKVVETCGSPADGNAPRYGRSMRRGDMDTYKCDYDEDGELTYIRVI